jgi:plasmid stabilization system protein ParE
VTAVRLSAGARKDLFAAYQHYEDAAIGLGDGLLTEFEQVCRLVSSFPELGTRVSARLRRVLTNRYPYAVFYRANDREILIVAVAHTSRLPGYWKRRRDG